MHHIPLVVDWKYVCMEYGAQLPILVSQSLIPGLLADNSVSTITVSSNN